MKKTISIFGATGSIGQSTAKVIGQDPEAYDVNVVTAHRDAEGLAQCARMLNSKQAVIADEGAYASLKEALSGTDVKISAGRQALLEAAEQKADWCMHAIVGMAGLEPLLQSIRLGGTVAIANKEPLVAAGAMVMEQAAASGATLLPVDSEHNAIFQVFEKANKGAISRLILTGSGGPFRTWEKESIKAATPEQALAHPNWSMGKKITIDSATLMNKGLEVIEAHHFFGIPSEAIEVIIHPQSTVHSMVEYVDGSILAQLGAPDMCTPIAHTLAYPRRMQTPGQTLDFSFFPTLSFEAVDHERFPALSLSYAALKQGQAACIALNAANEEAVYAFLEGGIGFYDITDVVRVVLDSAPAMPLNSLNDILEYDKIMREDAKRAIVKRQTKIKAA